MTPPSSPIRTDFNIPYMTGYPPVQSEKDKVEENLETIQ